MSECSKNILENLKLRLLDLTARNKLISFKHNKSSLRVVDEIPNQLCQRLLDKKAMTIIPVPEPPNNEPPNDLFDAEQRESSPKEYAEILNINTDYEMPLKAEGKKHTDNKIQTLLYADDLWKTLDSLYSKHKLAISETGSNPLYIVFGFLSWLDNDIERLAPLFLLPINLKKSLNRQSKQYEYAIRYTDEDISTNIALQEKFKKDFKLYLPDVDIEEVAKDVESYLEEVSSFCEQHRPQWQILRYISLGLFDSRGAIISGDLGTIIEQNIEHPIIEQILCGSSDEQNTNISYIDKIDDIHTKYPLVLDADSSQHQAIIDSVNNKNLVIEGPPGTGKSQTIANLIIANIKQGKSVLFIAEKMSALEVVKRRIDEVNLGDFFLELHSNKSNKSKVLESIKQRLDKRNEYQNYDIEQKVIQYEQLKNKLNKHCVLINRQWQDTGLTVHEILTKAVRYKQDNFCTNIDLTQFNQATFTPEVSQDIEDIIDNFIEHYRSLNTKEIKIFAWYGINSIGESANNIRNSLDNWQRGLSALTQNTQSQQAIHLLSNDLAKSTDNLGRFISMLQGLQAFDYTTIAPVLHQLPRLCSQNIDTIQTYFNRKQSLINLREELVHIPDNIFQNLAIVSDELHQASANICELIRNKDTTLITLPDKIKTLQSLEATINALAGSELLNNNNPHLAFSASTNGITQIINFIQTVTALPINCIDSRDDIFKNRILDTVLPDIQQAIKPLRLQQETLSKVFNLSNAGDNEVLTEIKNTLNNGGLFKWFKNNWRCARGKLLAMKTHPKIKFSNLVEQLDSAIQFNEENNLFNNRTDRQYLADFFQGIDTDIEQLISLRQWYKTISDQYSPLGNQAEFGEVIINLTSGEIQETHNLPSVEACEETLQKCHNLTETYTLDYQDNEIFIGENGVITVITDTLEHALEACRDAIYDDTISIHQFNADIQQWREFKKITEELVELSINKGDILEGEAIADNLLRPLLAIAQYIDTKINDTTLKEYIYNNPSATTFNDLRDLLSTLQPLMNDNQENFENFKEISQLNLAQWQYDSSQEITITIDKINKALSNDRLSHYLRYLAIREQLSNKGFKNLVLRFEEGQIVFNQLKDAYKSAVYQLLSNAILENTPELTLFSSVNQESIQTRFKECDNQLKALQAQKIAYSVDKKARPEKGNCSGPVSTYTELGLLNHISGQARPRASIRSIIHRSRQALQALKPCFMMSPASVAQYLPHDKMFDLVVMDEASQIKPEYAIGSVARTQQLVIVGDDKQLPPTNFFNTIIESEDENTGDIADSESILDMATSKFKKRSLQWHYRSQHPSLIAFSNLNFYNSSLIIFPSPFYKNKDYGIEYKEVGGHFINRQNEEEATHIAKYLSNHLLNKPNETIGIVAMNTNQREKIKISIYALAKEDVTFAVLLEENESKLEGYFVKNLENVQGDERDVIVISMTYGKNNNDNFYQRFGPINGLYGWRRLNVLFTRSRKKMYVVTSMNHNDIQIHNNSSRGVKALRDFLQYCQTGELINTIVGDRPPDSDFEVAVMAKLELARFECAPQVGVNGFFIDIGVKNPDNLGHFLLGVECDGATYHSAKSARDRDRLRQDILEKQGWNIHRIWSTDWFSNSEDEIRKVVDKLKSLQ